MGLQEKYSELINLATDLGIDNLQVREQNSVLYIDGDARSAADKDKLWVTYNKIDPDYRSADVVMNIEVTQGVLREYTVENGDSLSKIPNHTAFPGRIFLKPIKILFQIRI